VPDLRDNISWKSSLYCVPGLCDNISPKSPLYRVPGLRDQIALKRQFAMCQIYVTIFPEKRLFTVCGFMWQYFP